MDILLICTLTLAMAQWISSIIFCTYKFVYFEWLHISKGPYYVDFVNWIPITVYNYRRPPTSVEMDFFIIRLIFRRRFKLIIQRTFCSLISFRCIKEINKHSSLWYTWRFGLMTTSRRQVADSIYISKTQYY